MNTAINPWSLVHLPKPHDDPASHGWTNRTRCEDTIGWRHLHHLGRWWWLAPSPVPTMVPILVPSQVPTMVPTRVPTLAPSLALKRSQWALAPTPKWKIKIKTKIQEYNGVSYHFPIFFDSILATYLWIWSKKIHEYLNYYTWIWKWMCLRSRLLETCSYYCTVHTVQCMCQFGQNCFELTKSYFYFVCLKWVSL